MPLTLEPVPPKDTPESVRKMADDLDRYGDTDHEVIEALRDFADLLDRVEKAPVIVYGRDCDCPAASGHMDETVVGKRVALVEVE
jgi:hypothetical protein